MNRKGTPWVSPVPGCVVSATPYDDDDMHVRLALGLIGGGNVERFFTADEARSIGKLLTDCANHYDAETVRLADDREAEARETNLRG